MYVQQNIHSKCMVLPKDVVDHARVIGQGCKQNEASCGERLDGNDTSGMPNPFHNDIPAAAIKEKELVDGNTETPEEPLDF